MSISGVYLCFPQTFTRSVSAVLPSSIGSGEPLPGFVPTPGPLDADKAVASSASVVPRCARRRCANARSGRQTIVVYLENTRFGGATQPQILVTFNEQTGDVGYVDDPRYYGMAETVLNFQNVVHYGVGFGLVWKILVFVSRPAAAFLRRHRLQYLVDQAPRHAPRRSCCRGDCACRIRASFSPDSSDRAP